MCVLSYRSMCVVLKVSPGVAKTYLFYSYYVLGCWWHGHDCQLNRGKPVNTVRNKPMAELLEETRTNSAYITSQGYNLVVLGM